VHHDAGHLRMTTRFDSDLDDALVETIKPVERSRGTVRHDDATGANQRRDDEPLPPRDRCGRDHQHARHRLVQDAATQARCNCLM
jgi:hypothetical protein